MAAERLIKISNEQLSEEEKKVIKVQSTIIELQSKIAENCGEKLPLLTTAVQREVKSEQSVVDTEMKGYFSVPLKTLVAALARQKIVVAI